MATHEQPTLEGEMASLPRLSRLSPKETEKGVCLYGLTSVYGQTEPILEKKDGLISATKDADKLGISPGRSLFRNAVGWQVETLAFDDGQTVRTEASYLQALRGQGENRFCNVWVWNDVSGLKMLRTEFSGPINLMEQVAIIPVPEKKGSKLPDDRGGVLVIPISRLKNDHTKSMVVGFLEGRFQGR